MKVSIRHLLLASTAATLIGYAGGAAAQTASTTAPGATPTLFAQMQQLNTQLNTTGTQTGAFGSVPTISTTTGAATGAASSSLNSLAALSLTNQRNTGIDLGSAASPTGAPLRGAAAIGSVQEADGANVTATGINGRISTTNSFAGVVTAPITSSRDSISVAAGLNQGVNSIEGSIPLSLAGGLASEAMSLSDKASTLSATLSVLSSQVATNAVGGFLTSRARADGNRITVAADGADSGLSATSALLSQGAISAAFAGNDATNTIIARGGDSLNVSAAIGNAQVMESKGGIYRGYDVGNVDSVLRTQVGSAGLALGSVAAVDGGAISASNRLNTASNILGAANGEFMNGEQTALGAPTATTTSVGATADYVVGNLQRLNDVDANATTSGARVDVTLGGPIDASSVARVASNRVSAETIGNAANNTVALGSNSSVAPTIAVVSSQTQVGSDPTTELLNSASVTQARFGVLGTVATAGLMQVTGNTLEALAMGNTATNVAALQAGGATSGGDMAVLGRQEVTQVQAQADILATSTGSATLSAAAGVSTGRIEVTNNRGLATAVQNDQTNQLFSSGVIGASTLSVTNSQTATGDNGGAAASYVQGSLAGESFIVASQTTGAGARVLSSENQIGVSATNNRSTNTLSLAPLNPVTGTATVTNTQSATSQFATASVTGGTNVGAATMLASGTGATNTVTSYGNSIRATATGNAGTSTVGNTRFSSFR